MRSRNWDTAMSVATVSYTADLLRQTWPADTAKRASAFGRRSYRTVQDWLQRRCTPSADELLHMARQSAELRAELVALLGEWNAVDQVASCPMDQARLQGRGDICGFPRPPAQADAAGVTPWDCAEREWC